MRTKKVKELPAGPVPCGARVGKAAPGLSMSLRTIAFETGRRAVVPLAGPGGTLDPYVAANMLTMARQGMSPHTAINRSIGILRGLEWCSSRGINVVDRCRGGYLTDIELVELALHLQGQGTRPLALAPVFYRAFIEHLTFIGRRVGEPGNAEVRSRAVDFETDAGAYAPVNRDGMRLPRLGLTLEQRDLLQKVVIVGHPDNPWGTRAFRNLCAVRIGYQLGLRAGELLALQVRDVDLRAATLRIERRPNDPADPRALAPLPKTLDRTLPLSPELTVALNQLLSERRSLRASRRHPYVFTNIEGEPLSERGLRMIFEDLRNAVPELGPLTMHVLRHNWNDLWNEDEGNNGGGDPKAQNDAMGWVPGSAMPSRYGRRSQEAIANTRLLRMQERSFASKTPKVEP